MHPAFPSSSSPPPPAPAAACSPGSACWRLLGLAAGARLFGAVARSRAGWSRCRRLLDFDRPSRPSGTGAAGADAMAHLVARRAKASSALATLFVAGPFALAWLRVQRAPTAPFADRRRLRAGARARHHRLHGDDLREPEADPAMALAARRVPGYLACRRRRGALLLVDLLALRAFGRPSAPFERLALVARSRRSPSSSATGAN